MPCIHPLHLHKGQWCVSAPILCRCAWKSLSKSSHCDLFGRLGCTARLSSSLSIMIRGGLGGISPLPCPCCFLRKLASLWRLWLCISRLCQRFSRLSTMLGYMAEIQLAAGRPSVTSQPGVPLGSKDTLNSSVCQCLRCGWRCFVDRGAHGAGEWLPSLQLFLSEYKHGDCVRSIDTFGLMAVWTIVVQSGTVIGHKCTKHFVRNIICKSTITHMVTLGSSPCAHHQGVLGSGFMASPVLKLGIRWG
jgi:hypothetical protein